MRKILGVWLLLNCFLLTAAQNIQSPAEFLGYELGQRFTAHHKVLEYCQYLSSVSKNIKLQWYGESYEGRPLLLAFIASDKNIQSLEQIRLNNLRLAGLESGEVKANQPAVIWMSYNVHGNEAVSSEAALLTLFDLLNPANQQNKQWLQNTVVILDPCMNPDGRERYVNFYNTSKNVLPDPIPFTREHLEPWPGGRTNHYYFDLNRDWAWQSQKETHQRMEVYNKWLPHVHVDFHEQGINAPYYFAPAAEPFHQDITKWQREFQTVIGKNNARYFDKKGWLYFTRERFDLLYPSYGDTYPTYNGSVGMTFEQGGAGRAGLAVLTKEGDTLTLNSRIEHHHTTGLSTIEAVAQNAGKIVAEFGSYFRSSKINPAGPYKSYVIKGENPEKIKTLASLLSRNGISYGFGSDKDGRGLNYLRGKIENFKIGRWDMVINAHQPKSVLVKVLFEPETMVSDSVTYDITAWALPYAYGLNAFACKSDLKALYSSLPALEQDRSRVADPVAYVANWNSAADVEFLSSLLKKDIRVRYSEVSFHVGNKQFNPGSLIITRAGNERLGANFENAISAIAKKHSAVLHGLSSGFLERGPDLGSDKVRFIRKPKVALVYGQEISSMAMGEIWHFFEQQLGYPVSLIKQDDIQNENISLFNVIILPDGDYSKLASDRLLNWVNSGGKLIALQNAVAQLSGRKGFNIRQKEDTTAFEEKPRIEELLLELKPYASRERESVKSNIPGAIFRVDLDNTHPLAFGFPNYYYTLKLDDKIYNLLSGGWNVGLLKNDNHVAGFAGADTRKKLVNGLLFGVQESGQGSIVYLAENPLFRSFWENGKLLFSNAVFMVGQ